MLSGEIFFSSLAPQSGGERQQHLQRGLVQLLATCFASRGDTADLVAMPLRSSSASAIRLGVRRGVVGRRWVNSSGAARRRPCPGAAR